MHHQITLSLHLNWHVLCVSLPSYLFCLHPSYSSFLIFLHFCLLSVSSEIFHSMNCIVIPQHPIFWPWFFFYSHFSCFLLHGIYFREGSEGELHPSYWSPTYSPSSGICRIPSDSSQPTKWLEEVKNGSQRSEASIPYLDIKYCNKGFLRVGGDNQMVVFTISVTQFLSILNIEMTKDIKFLYLSKGGRIWRREVNPTHVSFSCGQLC